MALLLLIVLAAIGCVLWFLNEAARNERVALRETLAEAYRAQLVLIQARVVEEWHADLAAPDAIPQAPARFANCVAKGLAQSAICLDGGGRVAYPSDAIPRRLETSGTNAAAGASLQAALRGLANAGNPKALARFVIEMFPASDLTTDAEGRLIAPDAELLALQEIGNPQDPDFRVIADRLDHRLNDYVAEPMPSGQRRFVMRSLEELDPSRRFPLLDAEDLAARFLDSHTAITGPPGLHETELPGIWAIASPSGATLYLFTVNGFFQEFSKITREIHLPQGAFISVIAPGDDATGESAIDSVLATMPAGPELPGGQLAIGITDRTLFDTQAASRVKFLVLVAACVIAAITALAIFIARAFGSQVRLARLKNDLVATVSHELKTPLTAMRALVDTLVASDRLEETTTREYLHLIATENARLSRLIENFLTFSRLERNKFAFDFKPFRPEALVEAAVAAFGERAQAPGCTLEIAVEEKLPAIRGDSEALTTALLNLLDNAWKYTGAEKRIRIGARFSDGRVLFEVMDNGPGLSARETQRVFGQFYQGDQRLARTAGGCGLGLSIVLSIVRNHHGDARVTSRPGAGSTFTIEIPAIPA
jgi:signal transduction histidine kinase